MSKNVVIADLKEGFFVNKDTKEIFTLIGTGIFIVLFVIITLCSFHAVIAKYHIWSQSQKGQAELSKAEFTKKIAVREAEAKMESAKMLAKAEVERAKGVAEANKIIGESLKNNESYLRYLWVEGLQHTQNQIVYVPTEGALPILEAGKR